MFKKIIFVVGALLVATVTSSVSAHASIHRHSKSWNLSVQRQGHAGKRVSGRRVGHIHRGSRSVRVAWHHRHGRLASTDAMIRRYVGPRSRYVQTASAGGLQTGGASYYGGGRTASGGHVGAATCAHRSLPFGTRVLVTNLANAHQAILTVNDRGPFVRGRIIDVSTGAAMTLGMLHSGTARVSVQIVGANS